MRLDQSGLEELPVVFERVVVPVQNSLDRLVGSTAESGSSTDLSSHGFHRPAFLAPSGVERWVEVHNLKHRVWKSLQQLEVVALHDVGLSHSPKLTE